MTWFKKIIPSIGLLVGMVFVAIGAIMLLSATFKLVFNVSTNYNDYYMCEYRYNAEQGKDIKLSPEESEACIEKQIVRDEENFVKDKANNIIDGAAFLAVGAFFWIFFWRKNKED